jgi:hypothetical protein
MDSIAGCRDAAGIAELKDRVYKLEHPAAVESENKSW